MNDNCERDREREIYIPKLIQATHNTFLSLAEFKWLCPPTPSHTETFFTSVKMGGGHLLQVLWEELKGVLLK